MINNSQGIEISSANRANLDIPLEFQRTKSSQTEYDNEITKPRPILKKTTHSQQTYQTSNHNKSNLPRLIYKNWYESNEDQPKIDNQEKTHEDYSKKFDQKNSLPTYRSLEDQIKTKANQPIDQDLKTAISTLQFLQAPTQKLRTTNPNNAPAPQKKLLNKIWSKIKAIGGFLLKCVGSDEDSVPNHQSSRNDEQSQSLDSDSKRTISHEVSNAKEAVSFHWEKINEKLKKDSKKTDSSEPSSTTRPRNESLKSTTSSVTSDSNKSQGSSKSITPKASRKTSTQETDYWKSDNKMIDSSRRQSSQKLTEFENSLKASTYNLEQAKRNHHPSNSITVKSANSVTHMNPNKTRTWNSDHNKILDDADKAKRR